MSKCTLSASSQPSPNLPADKAGEKGGVNFDLHPSILIVHKRRKSLNLAL